MPFGDAEAGHFEVRDLRLAQNVVRELDVQLLAAINEYAAAKKLMPTTPLEMAAKAWKENVSEIKAVPVEQVAREYLAERKGKIASDIDDAAVATTTATTVIVFVHYHDGYIIYHTC